MSSAIYQCPACEETFIAPASRPESRLICPHCSQSDSVASFQAIEQDSGETKLAHLPQERTGHSHRSRRSQFPQINPPSLHPALEKLLSEVKVVPETRAEPPVPIRSKPEPSVPAQLPKPFGSPPAEDQEDPPSAAPAAPPPSISPTAARNQSPTPAQAIASIIDADFEIVVLHPRLSEIGGRSWIQSEALLALEPWEDPDARPHLPRWGRIALIVLAVLFLLAIVLAALLLTFGV
ncbi:MAG TPA: hypothetical protein VMN36_15210 [Verrucomicrobiales bacterium]|nr:hypothetical protein [Verrucomicrobiales bacterium]